MEPRAAAQTPNQRDTRGRWAPVTNPHLHICSRSSSSTKRHTTLKAKANASTPVCLFTNFVSVDTGNANRESTCRSTCRNTCMDDRNIQDRQVQTKVFSAAAKELQHANSAQLKIEGAPATRTTESRRAPCRAPRRGSRGSSDGDLESNPRSMHLSMQDT